LTSSVTLFHLAFGKTPGHHSCIKKNQKKKKKRKRGFVTQLIGWPEPLANHSLFNPQKKILKFFSSANKLFSHLPWAILGGVRLQ
jgi:hypothetical protein